MKPSRKKPAETPPPVSTLSIKEAVQQAVAHSKRVAASSEEKPAVPLAVQTKVERIKEPTPPTDANPARPSEPAPTRARRNTAGKNEAGPSAEAPAEPVPATPASAPPRKKAARTTPAPVEAPASGKPASRPQPGKKESEPQRAVPLPHPFRGYRVIHEDGCEAEVRAPVGHFYPYDPETVAFYCRDLGVARRICRKWSADVRIFVQGDEETTLHLPAKLYPEVASLIGVSRRAA